MWLFESAFDALVFDNQPSLRIMIECLLVRLLLQYPDQLLSLLWSHLEKVQSSWFVSQSFYHMSVCLSVCWFLFLCLCLIGWLVMVCLRRTVAGG